MMPNAFTQDYPITQIASGLPPTGERVLVGMSGGVDSAVAAALLVQQGCDVVGVTLRLYTYEESLEEVDAEKRECHPDAFIQDAQEVARVLNIPHHVIDAQETFRRIVKEPFMEAYAAGKTPLPCAVCNRDVKTAILHDLMVPLKATSLATGHYVQQQHHQGMVQIHRGQDAVRDQSFFLFNLKQEHVQVMCFPLGQFSKSQTREMAESFGLAVHKKAASQDLCFISQRSYAHVFTHNQKALQPGDIVDTEGTLLGTHKGLVHYTVGQRQGLGLGGFAEPLYVVQVDAENNRVVVGPRGLLAHRHVFLERINWLAQDLHKPEDGEKNYKITVKIRSSGRPLEASLLLSRDMGVVKLAEPEYGIAPGQACVFYEGTRLLGGGWIRSSAA